MTAPDTPTAAQTRTLVALLRVEARDGRATARTIAAEADRGVTTTHKNLEALIDLGFVTQTAGRHGTIWTAVAVVCGSWHP